MEHFELCKTDPQVQCSYCLQRVEALQETSRRVRSKLSRHPGQTQEDIGWTDALCKDMDEKAQEDHTCTLTKAERLRYNSNWSLALNSSGKNSGPLASRPVFRAAVALKDHLYREPEDYQPSIPRQDSRSIAKDNKFSETCRKGPHVV